MIKRIIIGVIQLEVASIFLILGAIALEPMGCHPGGYLSCFEQHWMDQMAILVFLGYIIMAILAARTVGKWFERRWKEE